MTNRKQTEVLAPAIPADEAFGNSIMSMRDAADAHGSRLHNALVNCEATYNRELARVNNAYQTERNSLTEQISQHERILNGCDAAISALKAQPSNVVSMQKEG